MAGDDFNWDDDNGFDNGNIKDNNEDSDEFEKTVDQSDNAFLDQQMEIPKFKKPAEPDSGGESDFPFSDIDDALAGVDVPAEPIPEPQAVDTEQEPGELTSISQPADPDAFAPADENELMEMGPDVDERAADVQMYEMDAEENLPPEKAPAPATPEPGDPFDPYVPASDKDEVHQPPPPPAEDEVMELESEGTVFPQPPADQGVPPDIGLAEEPLELDQKPVVPPRPEPEPREDALSLDDEPMALEEDPGPMGQAPAVQAEGHGGEEDFVELGSEAMIPSEEPDAFPASSPGPEVPSEPPFSPAQPGSDEPGLQLDSISEPEPSPTEPKSDDAFFLDEEAESPAAPPQKDAFEIESNEFDAPQTPEPLPSEPVTPVEQQQAGQADYTDMVVSNQEFLDIDEQRPAAPPEDTKTKESQHLIDDKDLPNISTEGELVEYTKKTTPGMGERTVQTVSEDSSDEPAFQPVPQGPEPGAKPIEEEESAKFYRNDFTAEPEASKGIPPKVVMFGGIGLAGVIILAVLFLVVFKGKDSSDTGKDGESQQVTQGERPDGLRSRNIRDRRYSKYIKEAKKFYDQRMYDEAEKNVQLALKNKRTVEANNLLKQIRQQTEELNKKAEMDKVQKAGEQLVKTAAKEELQPKVDPEEQDFQDAMKKGTIEAMEAYMAKYNEEARHYFQVYRKLRDLKVESTRKTKEEIKSRGEQIRRTPLRSSFLQLNQLAVEKKISEMPLVSNQFVSYTIGKDKVIVDYGTGLMWHLWQKPMNAGNARLFSARRLANYPNWRLPTIEELYSARRMNLRVMGFTAGSRVVLWSGDRDYQGSKIVWALEFPSGKVIPATPESNYYLCAVRSIR